MLSWIKDIDVIIFKFINISLTNDFFNSFLPFVRNELSWTPLYVFIIVFFLWKFRLKGLGWVVGALLTLGASDFLSSQVIKKTIMRPRPCHVEDEISGMVLRINCGTGFSFTSSHATNHMALAIFIILTTMPVWKKWRWAFLPWALLIGFAQVYVGVHYPFDVLCGFLLGSLVGATMALLYKKSKWTYFSHHKPGIA